MSDELVTALVDAATARQAARAGRTAFRKSPLSKFERSMRAAMNEYLHMRSQGVSAEDAERGIEAVLREAWPIRPSRFQSCDSCDGTGWRRTLCQHRVRCARYRCSLAEPEWEHPYVVPCDCEKGDRFRPRERTADDALTSVGRSKRPAKSKGWRALHE